MSDPAPKESKRVLLVIPGAATLTVYNGPKGLPVSRKKNFAEEQSFTFMFVEISARL
jgi:hypothetical protein